MLGVRRFLVVASLVLGAAALLPLPPALAEEPPAAQPAPTPPPADQPAPSEPAPDQAPAGDAQQEAPPAPPPAAEPTPPAPPAGDAQPEVPPAPAPAAEPAPPAPPAGDAQPETPPAPAAEPAPPAAPTFTVFATRQGLVGRRTANGHRIRPRDRFVALPSWGVLSSRGGYEYQVRVTYRGRSVVLPVWDVGPWNTRDDYWNPSRRYADLPVGMPMAQAARQQGYNGGRDEFGRRIRLPNGIDIADGAFWEDLGMSESDWVEVTFLWMGADPHASAEVNAASDELAVVEPDAVLLDDGAEGYDAPGGKFYDAPCGLNGRHAWTYGTPDPSESDTSASWRPALPAEGLYEIFAFIPVCGETPTESARYRVTHTGASTDVTINQAAAVGSWVSLGTYHMGADAAVELTDLTGDSDRVVRFDALKWLPRGDKAPPDARVTEAAPHEGGLLVRWAGTDDGSGIASYDVQVRLLPDGGWTDWQVASTASEALFVPPGPGAYAFRARARDWLGHEQPWREADDVTVQVGP